MNWTSAGATEIEILIVIIIVIALKFFMAISTRTCPNQTPNPIKLKPFNKTRQLHYNTLQLLPIIIIIILKELLV